MLGRIDALSSALPRKCLYCRYGYPVVFGKMRHSTKEEADAYDAMLKSKSVEIRPVDRDALLALADEMQGYADGAASGDGFPYVNAGSLWSYADRIREACGMVDAG